LLVAHRKLWDLGPRGELVDPSGFTMDRSIGGVKTAAPGSALKLSTRTATELCFVPASVSDGLYMLALQVRRSLILHTGGDPCAGCSTYPRRASLLSLAGRTH
jgi:hypothetical protein